VRFREINVRWSVTGKNSHTVGAAAGEFWDFRELSWLAPGIPGDVDETALLRRARQGDEASFGALYARYQRQIFRYAARMCGADTADDVVQETFMTVLREGDRFDAARGTLGAYLFGIARHRVLKQLGGRYEPLDEDLEVADKGHADVLAVLTHQERVDAVRAAVQSLPLVYREVVVLCDLEEIDYMSAAQIVGCPIGTVRSRLHRARALLMSKLASLREPARSCRG
jgi:RNA polymerase sigma-70 factor (ECF subfamily)